MSEPATDPRRPAGPPDGAEAPPSRCGGFTLLEVLVALGILAIVLLAVFRLQAQALSMSQESRFYTLAPHLARSVLKERETAPDAPLASGEGDFGADYPGYTWKITVEPHAARTLGGEISADLRRIEVQVSLEGGRLTYGFRTYRFVRE